MYIRFFLFTFSCCFTKNPVDSEMNYCYYFRGTNMYESPHSSKTDNKCERSHRSRYIECAWERYLEILFRFHPFYVVNQLAAGKRTTFLLNLFLSGWLRHLTSGHWCAFLFVCRLKVYCMFFSSTIAQWPT